MNTYEQLDAWIDAHFDEQVRFLQELIRVPTDTPPGNNAPHADRTAELLQGMGLDAEKHPVPEAEVRAAGLESITNLVVRRRTAPENRAAQRARRRGAPRRGLDP
jgi:succinyl-diaminopimelate desuccinylase